MNPYTFKPENEADTDGFIKCFQVSENEEPFAGYTELAKPQTNGSIDYKLYCAFSKIEEKRAKLWELGRQHERLNTAFYLAASIKSACVTNSAHPQFWRDREKASIVADGTLKILEEIIAILDSDSIPDYLILKKMAHPALLDDPNEHIQQLRNWLEAIRPDEVMLEGRNSRNQFGATARDRKMAVGLSDFLLFLIEDKCTSEVAAIVSHLAQKTIRTTDVDGWLRKRRNKDPNLGS